MYEILPITMRDNCDLLNSKMLLKCINCVLNYPSVTEFKELFRDACPKSVPSSSC